MWVGTIAGLGRWEGGRARTVELPLAERSILALHADGAALWVGTADGIARLDGAGWQTWKRGEAGLRSAWATSFATHAGALHVGSYGGGVQRWDGTQWQGVGENGPAQVTALASEGETLWAGSPRGLWGWEGTRWQAAPLPSGRMRVTALLAARGALWVGGEAGLVRGAAGQWEPRPADDAVGALADTEQGILVATPGALRLAETGELWERSERPLSALVTQGDTLWVGTMGGGVRALGQQPVAPAQPPPLPVVLLHGLGDSNRLADSNLRFLGQWLRNNGHAVWLSPTQDTAPLLDNVAALRRTIARARQATGAEQVYVIAHSFGGVVGRAYLSSGASDVQGLMTLGTPHAGVRLAYDALVSEEEGATPSEVALLPEHAALLAPFMETGDTPQLHIGGTLLPEDNLFAGFPPHDGIVTAASALAAPGATRSRALLHGWTLQTLEWGIPSLLWPDDLYVNTLRPWMQSVTAGEPDRTRAAEFPSQPLASPPGCCSISGWRRGNGLPSRCNRIGQPATWFLNGAGVTMELIAPDGTRHRSDRFGLGSPVAHLPYRENPLSPLDLWSTSGQAGLWQVEVRNESPRPLSARLTLVEPLAPAWALTIADPWVSAEEPVRVRVQAEPSQALSVTLGSSRLPMVEVAPGDYRSVLIAPPTAGYHALRVSDGKRERWGIVGVRSDRWIVEEAVLDGSNPRRLRLTLRGAGQVALGWRLMQGEQRLAAQIVGPFRFLSPGTHTLTQPLPLPDEAAGATRRVAAIRQYGGATPRHAASHPPISWTL